MSYGLLQVIRRHPQTPGELDELGGLMKSRNRFVRELAIWRYRHGMHQAALQARRRTGRR